MKKSLAAIAVLCLAASNLFATVYTDASVFPIYGKAVEQTNTRYERLPGSLEGKIREDLWFLGRNSAGLYIRFRSNSTSIRARWTSTFSVMMNHMTPTGIRGLDLYALTDGTWRFVGSGRPDTGSPSTDALIIGNMDPQEREFMLYLSLYDGVSSLDIGIDDDAYISQPEVPSPASGNPVVMYGTSILQGGCASRPGMAHTNILSRRIDREVINLGFSGNALLDMEIADLMASIPNPALYILDYVPNAGAGMIDEHGEEFFLRIRNAHPDVPVIFIEDPIFTHSMFDKNIKAEVERKNAAQKALFSKLKKQGEKKIYYVASDKLIGTDGEACVDGIHFTDLGMERYVETLLPVIKKHLKR